MAQQTPYSDKRFLILDDQAEMRSSLRSQVGSLGCEQVTTAASVRDALQKLDRGLGARRPAETQRQQR